MADVARPGMGEQVVLVAGLRWRMFRNSLVTTAGRMELAARILLGALAALWAVGTGVGLGIGAYFITARDKFVFLALLFWAVFLFWQVVPLMVAASHASFDFQSLLRFPLRFSVFFLLSLAYGLSDPPVVTALIWLLAIATGITLARPDLLGSTLLVVTVFAAMNLLLSRAVFAWLERWLARRRTREALVAIALLTVLTVQLSAVMADHWGKRIAPYLSAALPALQLLPPGLAGRALAGAAQGSVRDFVSSTVLLAVYALAFGWFLRTRLRAQYLGEVLAETQAPTLAPKERARAAPLSISRPAEWRVPGISGPALAVLGKEWRYLFRNSAMLLLLAVPLVLILIFSVSFSRPQPRGSAFQLSPDLAFPAAIAYMFLIISQMAFNSFAFEGRGVQLLFVAPVRFRDVLLGKNLLLGTILVLESGLIWLVVGLVLRPPGARMVLTTYAGLLFAAVMLSMVGNWLSIRFPRRMEFGRARRRVSGVSALVGLGLQAVLLGVVAGVYGVCRLLGQPWLAPLVLLGLSAAALRVYVAALDRLAQLAAEQRETLTVELAR